MNVLCDYHGWAKLHRAIFRTIVWQNPEAFRVFSSMLVCATHMKMLTTVGNVALRLHPGQLTATEKEISDITGYNTATVRKALDVLTTVRAIECVPKPELSLSVITVNSPPFIGETDDTANGALMNQIKNKKNILYSSSDSLILSLWKQARENAGLEYCEDAVTLEGAAAMAALWLDTEKATPDQLQGAMRRFLHEVQNNERARLYTLRTLAHSLSTYLEKPQQSPPPRTEWCTWTCGTCGVTAAGRWPLVGDPPGYKPCIASVCGGMMIPDWKETQ